MGGNVKGMLFGVWRRKLYYLSRTLQISGLREGILEREGNLCTLRVSRLRSVVTGIERETKQQSSIYSVGQQRLNLPTLSDNAHSDGFSVIIHKLM